MGNFDQTKKYEYDLYNIMNNVYYTHRTGSPENRPTHLATRVYRPIRLRCMCTKYLSINSSAGKKKKKRHKTIIKVINNTQYTYIL